ncbi:hypothetical protein VCM_00155 [Pseudomonas phage VCM]|uniref:Uncharacterized protein n=1 Tax=Pseudomonas phage VCM TaxID=1729937 RepID=A0A0S4KWF2_9CAUD|nr:hypothetical protein VCM_00155 [Pseudomonas phage VCM]CUR44357.1 hypothetical protein VCM_00155 [Pseudomonas phage VCM]
MARMTVDTNATASPDVVPGTLMYWKEDPTYVVMCTGILMGDEFPGVALDSGLYGEQWIIDEYAVFQGKITLEQ